MRTLEVGCLAPNAISTTNCRVVFEKVDSSVFQFPYTSWRDDSKTFLMVLLGGLNETKHVKHLAQGQALSSYSVSIIIIIINYMPTVLI